MTDEAWVDRFSSLFLILSEQSCSCGDRRRPHINHRKKVPCWTYIGDTRVNIDSAGRVTQ